ncbi:MAG: hypothetical protein FOGNACKC_00762 [Anaerolineae bacterium]|nr:hypothetical protein [Anaerolineae bacterium]
MSAKELKTLNKIFAPLLAAMPSSDTDSFVEWAFKKNRASYQDGTPTYSIHTTADDAIVDFINEVVLASVDPGDLEYAQIDMRCALEDEMIVRYVELHNGFGDPDAIDDPTIWGDHLHCCGATLDDEQITGFVLFLDENGVMDSLASLYFGDSDWRSELAGCGLVLENVR